MKTSDSTQTIFHSAKRFLGGTLLSRSTGLLRDVAMAYTFGTAAAVSAFLVAFRFAHLLRRLFGEGALQIAFIPYFEELRLKDSQRAAFFFRDLVASLTLFLILLSFAIMLILGILFSYQLLSPDNNEILFLTLLLMPSLLFICLFGVNASLLQCEKKFFITGAAPVAFNLIWASGVLTLWKLTAFDAMPWLAVWVIIACFGQWFITVPQTLSQLKKLGLTQPWRQFNFFPEEIRKLIRPLFLGMIGVAASQVNNALDALFARYASLEGPAYLWYALRLQQLPLALFGIAIANALLPPLTRALKTNDILQFNHFLTFVLQRTMALMLPITAAIFVMGDTAIQLVYGRGDFTEHSIIGTSACLWGYASGLLPMTLVLILAPAFYAKNDYRTTTLASLIAVVVNLLLNGWWIMGMGIGTESVAWATSLSAGVNLAWLAWKMPYKDVLKSSKLWLVTGKILFATILASIAVMLVDTWFGGSTAIQIWKGEFVKIERGFFGQLTRLLWQLSVFCGVWVGLIWSLDCKELVTTGTKVKAS